MFEITNQIMYHPLCTSNILHPAHHFLKRSNSWDQSLREIILEIPQGAAGRLLKPQHHFSPQVLVEIESAIYPKKYPTDYPLVNV